LPRHAASCPVGLGVSCSADRNIKGKITKDGIFLEQLETNPKQFLPEVPPHLEAAVEVDLNVQWLKF
jgi:fumarate hydratase class I